MIFDLKGKMRAQKKEKEGMVGGGAGVVGSPPNVSASTNKEPLQRTNVVATMGDPVHSLSDTRTSFSEGGRPLGAPVGPEQQHHQQQPVSSILLMEEDSSVSVPNSPPFSSNTLLSTPQQQSSLLSSAATTNFAGGGGDNSKNSEVVLFDGDLLTITKGLPLTLTEEAKRLLDAALIRDTTWLASMSIIDYSLLIGVEGESGFGGEGSVVKSIDNSNYYLDPAADRGNLPPGILICGIIDYVRRFDIVKRIENQVKAVTQLATNVEPTVVEPGRYSGRILDSLAKYITGSPTKWGRSYGSS